MITRFIIVSSSRDIARRTIDNLQVFVEIELARVMPVEVYDTGYRLTIDEIEIKSYTGDYKFLDGLRCDYFAVSSFNLDDVKRWRDYLSKSGKELTTLNAIKDKIKELCLKEKNEMRMDEMNRLFEERGFTVTRNWCRDGYHFIISKGGHQYSSVYVYPSGLNVREASQHQREFVDDMIKRFEDHFKIHLPDKFTLSSAISAWDQPVPKEMWTKVAEYCDNVDTDIAATLNAYQPENGPLQVLNSKFLIGNIYKERRVKSMYAIKKVIFNSPATIVFWMDGTKTVVKAQGDDIFDPEKGLAMAISKKALGNKGNYCNELKKWLPEEDTLMPPFTMDDLKAGVDNLRKTLANKLGAPEKIFEEKKYNPVQKAYDILVGWRDGKVPVSKEISENMPKIDELIGYLGEALDD